MRGETSTSPPGSGKVAKIPRRNCSRLHAPGREPCVREEARWGWCCWTLVSDWWCTAGSALPGFDRHRQWRRYGRGSHVHPEPANIIAGRRFLYDARETSANGTSACASHIFGDMDQLAWDLGNPDGDLLATPIRSFQLPEDDPVLHPMINPDPARHRRQRPTALAR